MKKLLLSLLMLVFMAGGAQAAGDLNSHSYTIGVGYSTISFVVDTADPDSAVKKIVLFRGTTRASMVRLDSLTTVTDPDTLAITGLIQGTTYYWYVQIIDSTTTIYEPTDLSGYSVTTTDLQQNVSVIYAGYSTAGIMADSAGVYPGVALDSLRLDIDKTDGTTYSASITTVTYPDTFAVTGLDEGVTYFYRTIAFLTDSSAADTLTAASFTTTDLGSVISVLRSNLDSLILIIDSTTMCPETLIVQWGAGLAAITAFADTTATPNCPDTITITGLIEGGTYHYRALGLLVDSAVVDTGTIGTYTRAHNSFVETPQFGWPSNSSGTGYLHWDFDNEADEHSTGPLPIESKYLRIHVFVDGEDDVSTGDSIQAFLWSWEAGDSTVIDTLVPMENDTTTITPLKYLMYPTDLSDSSMTYYPEFDWGTHYSVSAVMVDTTIYADSVLGIRSVHVVIEEIE